MSTPVCLANAVADALSLREIDLPLTPAKLAGFIHSAKSARKHEPPLPLGASERVLTGEGEAIIAADPLLVWRMLLDIELLAGTIPGAQSVHRLSDTQFRADVTIGIGPVRGRYRVEIQLGDAAPPNALTLKGTATGTLGFGQGSGRVTLSLEGDRGTRLSYQYQARIGGKVAAVGGRLLDGAARLLARQFFTALAARAGGKRPQLGRFTWWNRLRGRRS
jgi:2-furoyl-CoA dehydrogenase large subunit